MSGFDIAGLLLAVAGSLEQFIHAAKRLEERYQTCVSNPRSIKRVIQLHDTLLSQLQLLRNEHIEQSHILPPHVVVLLHYRMSKVTDNLQKATEKLEKMERSQRTDCAIKRFLRAMSTRAMCVKLLEGARFMERVIDDISGVQSVTSVVENLADSQTKALSGFIEDTVSTSVERHVKQSVEQYAGDMMARIFPPSCMPSSGFRTGTSKVDFSFFGVLTNRGRNYNQFKPMSKRDWDFALLREHYAQQQVFERDMVTRRHVERIDRFCCSSIGMVGFDADISDEDEAGLFSCLPHLDVQQHTGGVSPTFFLLQRDLYVTDPYCGIPWRKASFLITENTRGSELVSGEHGAVPAYVVFTKRFAGFMFLFCNLLQHTWNRWTLPKSFEIEIDSEESGGKLPSSEDQNTLHSYSKGEDGEGCSNDTPKRGTQQGFHGDNNDSCTSKRTECCAGVVFEYIEETSVSSEHRAQRISDSNGSEKIITVSAEDAASLPDSGDEKSPLVPGEASPSGSIMEDGESDSSRHHSARFSYTFGGDLAASPSDDDSDGCPYVYEEVPSLSSEEQPSNTPYPVVDDATSVCSEGRVMSASYSVREDTASEHSGYTTDSFSDSFTAVRRLKKVLESNGDKNSGSLSGSDLDGDGDMKYAGSRTGSFNEAPSIVSDTAFRRSISSYAPSVSNNSDSEVENSNSIVLHNYDVLFDLREILEDAEYRKKFLSEDDSNGAKGGGVYAILVYKRTTEANVREQLASIVERSGGVIESLSIRRESNMFLCVARVVNWFKDKVCLFVLDLAGRESDDCVVKELCNLSRCSPQTRVVLARNLCHVWTSTE